MPHETIVNPPWRGRHEPGRTLRDGCGLDFLDFWPSLVRSCVASRLAVRLWRAMAPRPKGSGRWRASHQPVGQLRPDRA